MTLIVTRETLELLEEVYSPLANNLQERLDTLTMRWGIMLGAGVGEIQRSDHGTCRIPAEEQLLLREQVRQLEASAARLAEAVYELTGEPDQGVVDDVHKLEDSPNFSATKLAREMEEEMRRAGAVDVTVEIDRLPAAANQQQCPVCEVRGSAGLVQCVLPDGHPGSHAYEKTE